MGMEKPLVPFRGKPLVLWALDVLSDVADEVVLSVAMSPSDELIETVGLEIVLSRDGCSGSGPMEGLHSAFSRVRGQYVAVAPCDAPFVTKDLFELLFKRAEGRSGAVPFVGGHYEPLIAVYRCEDFLKAMETNIAEGRLKLVDTYPLLDIAIVDEDDLGMLDLPKDPFTNINIIDDLERADRCCQP